MTVPSSVFKTESSLVKALKEESEILQNINDLFMPLARRFRLYFFWEQYRMDLKYTKDYIVEESSAAPLMDNAERCGIAADHRGMCKFASGNDQAFKTVIAALKRYLKDAPSVIQERWNVADTALKEIWRQEALEVVRGAGILDTVGL
jgi:protein SERAC1